MAEPTDRGVLAFTIVLAKLEEVLPPAVRETLRAPAEPQELAALGASLAEAGLLPADLHALLTWHNGQSWNAPLSKKNNRRLLSASEIERERSFFADPMSDFMEPWSASWLPVLTNDAGGLVVYETTGPQRGNLLHYWHDDSSRNVAYPSLLKWAEGLLDEYARRDA